MSNSAKIFDVVRAPPTVKPDHRRNDRAQADDDAPIALAEQSRTVTMQSPLNGNSSLDPTPLEKTFKLHPAKFFVPGRVFQVLFSELADEGLVLVQQCIFTYNRKGTAAIQVDPNEHGIIYTGSQEPLLTPREWRKEGRTLLGYSSGRVNADSPAERLDPLSRINYGKMYNIDYGVQVKNIGKLQDAYLELFVRQTMDCLLTSLSNAAAPTIQRPVVAMVQDESSSADRNLESKAMPAPGPGH